MNHNLTQVGDFIIFSYLSVNLVNQSGIARLLPIAKFLVEKKK